MGVEEHSYARYALPALLLTLVIGTLIVLTASGSSNDSTAGELQTTRTVVATPKRTTITVQPGDNPSAIAERAGIDLDVLLALNPRIDPRALRVGDQLKLAP